jgi:hypothetical protein
MRLLKTDISEEQEWPLQLKIIYGQDVPAYAILSHTWSEDPEDEVLFADINNKTYLTKPGYAKILATLRQAREDGLPYAWVDSK